jgi:hypothetical protein
MYFNTSIYLVKYMDINHRLICWIRTCGLRCWRLQLARYRSRWALRNSSGVVPVSRRNMVMKADALP